MVKERYPIRYSGDREQRDREEREGRNGTGGIAFQRAVLLNEILIQPLFTE